MADKHTKTPWAHEGKEIVTDWKHDGGRVIAIAAHGSISHAPPLQLGDEDWDLQMANLTFIARAVNSHDVLVAALKQCHTLISTLKHVDELDRMSLGAAVDLTMHKTSAALKLAEGESS